MRNQAGARRRAVGADQLADTDVELVRNLWQGDCGRRLGGCKHRVAGGAHVQHAVVECEPREPRALTDRDCTRPRPRTQLVQPCGRRPKRSVGVAGDVLAGQRLRLRDAPAVAEPQRDLTILRRRHHLALPCHHVLRHVSGVGAPETGDRSLAGGRDRVLDVDDRDLVHDQRGAVGPGDCDRGGVDIEPTAVGEADGARLEVGLAIQEQGRAREQVRVRRVDADPVTGDIGRQRGVDRHLERAGVWLLAHLDVEVVTGRGQGEVFPRSLVVDRDSVGIRVVRITVAGAAAGQACGVGGRYGGA